MYQRYGTKLVYDKRPKFLITEFKPNDRKQNGRREYERLV
jgi:hypothetical protein